MLRLALLVVLVTLVACRGGGTDAGPLGQAGTGNWFCETAEDGEQWDCVQDPELARTPRPSRPPPAPALPEDPAPVAIPEDIEAPGQPASAETVAATAEAVPEPPAQTADATAEPEPPAQTPDTDAAEPETPAQPTDAAAEAEPPAETSDAAAEPGTPALATSLMDLPADHYAVQILAMANVEQLEDFIAANQLDDALTARVERNGELYHVLLLGVYETLGLAEQASLDLPAPLANSEPWIRSVGSIQNAVMRGNALAAAPNE